MMAGAGTVADIVVPYGNRAHVPTPDAVAPVKLGGSTADRVVFDKELRVLLRIRGLSAVVDLPEHQPMPGYIVKHAGSGVDLLRSVRHLQP